MKSYDYANRQGVQRISWEGFGEMTRQLVEQLAQEKVDLVIGIARGGLIPATAIAAALRCEMFPIRLTRRMHDKVVHSMPVVLLDVAIQVANRKCAVVVDEIADTGQTLTRAVQLVSRRGVPRILTATLATHSWSAPRPDFFAVESDALIIFPWDDQVYIDGEWQTHPEIKKALQMQENLR
ncbi:MAG: phosphoribosyltransferase [Anaerolineales bacterium]|jgi:hypoxanthine phosphoribosyltransferase|nr:phosphoribosyltransferase [Anaerolineales bacterium]